MEWQPNPKDSKTCYIRKVIPSGGLDNDESEWPDIQKKMINDMVKFEKALSPFVTPLVKKLEI